MDGQKLKTYERERDRVLVRFGNVADAIRVVSRLAWSNPESLKTWGNDVHEIEYAYNTCVCYKDNVCFKGPLDDRDYELVLSRLRVFDDTCRWIEDKIKSRGYENCF